VADTYYQYAAVKTGKNITYGNAILGSEIGPLPYDTSYNGYRFRYAATADAPASRYVTVRPEPISISIANFTPTTLTYGYTASASA
jgi:hypothetical protein